MIRRLEQYDGVPAKWSDPHARARGLRIEDLDGSRLVERPDDPARSEWIEELLRRRRVKDSKAILEVE